MLAIPSAQDACGMEIGMEENEGKEKKQKKMQPKRWLAGFLGSFLGGTCRMYGTGDLSILFFSIISPLRGSRIWWITRSIRIRDWQSIWITIAF